MNSLNEMDSKAIAVNFKKVTIKQFYCIYSDSKARFICTFGDQSYSIYYIVYMYMLII